jgi:hypothetical protein
MSTMGNTPRFALLLSLSAAFAGAVLPTTARADDPPAGASAKEESGKSSDEDRATKLAKRKERLEQGAARLRQRAEELRKKAASGEAPPADGRRNRRTPEEQAQRLEEQAKKMEERAKNLGNEDRAGSTRATRDPGEARERRQKIRKTSLNRRWGTLLQKPEVIEEFKVHAERTARLKRIRSLCLEKGKDDPQAKRAAELLGKEEERHVRRMKEIQAQSKADDPAKAEGEEGQ